MGRRTSYSGAYGLALFLFGLYSAAALLGPAELWGVNLAKFQPRWWATASVLLGAIFLIPKFSQATLAVLDSGSRRLEASRGLRWFVGLVAVGGLMTLGLVFRVQTFFLGDANLRLNQISHGQLWLATEPGDFFLHAVLARAILGLTANESSVAAIWSYHLLSALAGGLFVLGIFRLGRYLVRSQALAISAVLGATGLLALFFGYVESYSIIAALLPWVLLAGLKVVDGRGGIMPLIWLIVVSALLHPVMLVLCSGPLLMALILPRLTESRQTVKFRYVLVGIGVIGMIALYLLRTANVGGTLYLLLPWVAGEGQSVLSYKHLLNLVNWLLLTAMSAPALLAIVLARRGETASIEKARRLMYALWTIVPVVLFAVFFTPHLSGPRDWDLFGVAVWLLVPSLMIAILANGKDRLPWQVVPSAVVGLLVAVSFIAVNVSVQRGSDRFVETIEVARQKNLFKEYKMLFTFAERHPELADRRMEYAEKAWQQPPYTHDDSLFILGSLAGLYLDRNDPRQAWYYISLALRADSLDLNVQLRRLDLVSRFGKDEDKVKVAADMERLFADNGLGLMNAGVTFMRLGQAERAGIDLERAFQLDSANATVLMNYATYQHQIGRHARCVELMERYLGIRPGTFQVEYYLAESLVQLGQIDRARQHLRSAAQLTQNNSQQQMVQTLSRKLPGGS